MRIGIVDDSEKFAQQLRLSIAQVCKQNKIECSIKYFDNPMCLVNNSAYEEYNVLFLDIMMPGMSGFEVADRINAQRNVNKPPFIVFVTSEDNLVFDALRKFPYSFIRKTHLEEVEECLLNLKEKLKASPTYTVRCAYTAKVLSVDDIMYLEKMGNYVSFVTEEGVYQERTGIGKKLELFTQYGFIRPHIGALVNPVYITEIHSGYLCLKDGKQMTISRSYAKEFRDKYNDWLVKNI